jgi:hypothetical protein
VDLEFTDIYFQDEFRYLLVTVEYEPFAHLGRPHSISYNAVKELFGKFFNPIKYGTDAKLLSVGACPNSISYNAVKELFGQVFF